ncbi:MAG TPA: acetylxylan esterase [Candidatus Methanoperedens sp.]
MSRKKDKKISKEINKKLALRYILAGIIIFLLLAYYFWPKESREWSVSEYGLLSYPENRGKVDVKLLKTETGDNYTLETISFQSKDYTVEGLLRVPVSGKKVPGVVILPGATVPMEGTQTLAEIFSNAGYASLGIEQRNRGGVSPEYDHELFKDGKEPIEHKMVFDALRAVDVLKQDQRVDPGRIAIVGESNGGRFAIIAAAIDPSIAGVIGISTSGYNSREEITNIRDNTLIRFYRSIDPDEYLDLLPPRKLVMMHSINDNIIGIDIAEATFNKAKEPKKLYKIETGTHGFSEGMRAPLVNELNLIFR